MSELDKTKKELIDVLDKIPGSGSFEGAELVRKAGELTDRMIALYLLPQQQDDEPVIAGSGK